MTDQHPPNSDKSKAQQRAPDPKKIDRIVVGEATRRKKGPGKRFKEMFLGGDSRTATEHVVTKVLIPTAQEMITNAAKDFIDGIVYGDNRRRGPRGGGPMGQQPPAHVQYNRFSKPSDPPGRNMSRRARAAHDFDEIVLDSRREAEEVLDQLYEYLNRYESVSVADLYTMVGLKTGHTDHRWGWTDLRGSGVTRIRGGHLLDLPEPKPLD